MKHFSLFLLLLVLMSGDLLFSQIYAGDKELSLTASFMSRKYEEADESWEVFNMSLGFGYFISQGFEIEPEIMLTSYEEEYSGWIFSGNVAYNFQMGSNNQNISPIYIGRSRVFQHPFTLTKNTLCRR